MGTFEVGRNAFFITILIQVYGDQRVKCCSLNVIELYNLIGSGTFEKLCLSGYGLGGSVFLWGRALRFPMLSILPGVSVGFLLSARCRTLSSSTMSACMPPYFLP